MKSNRPNKKNEIILLLGHKGLIGSAILKQLKFRGFNKIIVIEKKKIKSIKLFKTQSFF